MQLNYPLLRIQASVMNASTDITLRTPASWTTLPAEIRQSIITYMLDSCPLADSHLTTFSWGCRMLIFTMQSLVLVNKEMACLLEYPLVRYRRQMFAEAKVLTRDEFTRGRDKLLKAVKPDLWPFVFDIIHNHLWTNAFARLDDMTDIKRTMNGVLECIDALRERRPVRRLSWRLIHWPGQYHMLISLERGLDATKLPCNPSKALLATTAFKEMRLWRIELDTALEDHKRSWFNSTNLKKRLSEGRPFMPREQALLMNEDAGMML